MSQVVNAIYEDGVFKPIEKIGSLKTKIVRLEIKSIDEKEPSVQRWMKEMVSKHTRKKITPESIFTNGLNIKDYLNLTEEKREDLWTRWYKESEKKVAKIEAKELKSDRHLKGTVTFCLVL